MKQLLRYFWKENIALLCLMCLTGISTTIASLIHSFVLNALIQFDFQRFVKGIIWLLLTYGCFLLFTYLQLVYTSRLTQKMIHFMRLRLVKKISSLENHQFYQQEVGTYSSWITNDLTQIEQMGLSRLYELLGGCLTIGLSLLALGAIHWSLVLLTLIEMLLIIQLPKHFQPAIARSTVAITEKNEDFLSKSTNYLNGYNIFYSLQRFAFFTKGLRTISEKIADAKNKQMNIMAKIAIFGGIGNVLGQVSIFALTGYLAILTQLSIGVIAATTPLSSAVFNTVGNLSQYLAAIKSVQPIFEKHHSFLALKESPQPPAPIAVKNSLTAGFQLRSVAYSYPHNPPIFKELDFEFELTKKYAILGKSGTGKSTLLKILSGRLSDYDGSITFNQQELKTIPTDQLAQQLLYLDQKSELLHLSIRENLQLGEVYSDQELWAVLEVVGLKNDLLLHEKELDDLMGEVDYPLSGGQKQRFALARGLLRNKKIILFDEGTSNLDQESAIQIEELLLKQSDLTLIMISHHLTAAVKNQLDGWVAL